MFSVHSFGLWGFNASPEVQKDIQIGRRRQSCQRSRISSGWKKSKRRLKRRRKKGKLREFWQVRDKTCFPPSQHLSHFEDEPETEQMRRLPCQNLCFWSTHSVTSHAPFEFVLSKKSIPWSRATDEDRFVNTDCAFLYICLLSCAALGQPWVMIRMILSCRLIYVFWIWMVCLACWGTYTASCMSTPRGSKTTTTRLLARAG